MKRITIRDVAKEAGVSITTVSHALSGQGVLKQETRDRVIAIARKMQYIPDWSGQNLKSVETGMLGFFTYSIAGLYGVLVDAMYQECHANSYEMEIFIIESGERMLQMLMGKRVDGAVILHSELKEEQEKFLHEMEFPLVYLDRELKDQYASSVLFDSYESGRMAAEYLYSLGHRRILTVRGVDWTYDGEQRLKGCEDYMREKGCPVEKDYVVKGLFNQEVAYRETKLFLQKSLPLPDAVFAANDDSAIGCINALREAGYSVPDDVSIVGCDDIELSKWFVSALTTIHTHISRQGSLAMKELVQLVKGEKSGEIHRIAGELIERGSCKAKVL